MTTRAGARATTDTHLLPVVTPHEDVDEDGGDVDGGDADEPEQESPFRDRLPIADEHAERVLRHGEIDVLGRMPWSSNATFLCDVSHEGTLLQGVYKPHQGERPLWDFPSGLYKREVACYELSKQLGWDLVPPTVLRDGPAGDGSFQLFVPCDFEDHYFTLQDEEELLDSFHRLTVFDFVANSTDRKAGHVLRGKDGRIQAIDNGLSFHIEFKLRTVLWDFAGEFIPEAIIDDLKTFAADGLSDELCELLDTLEQDATITRARALINEGTFPTDPSGRRWPWPLV